MDFDLQCSKYIFLRFHQCLHLWCAANPPTVNLSQIAVKEKNPREPVLMITTPGADPSQEWTEMATKVVGPGRFTQLAMGGGQTQEAIYLLARALLLWDTPLRR